MRDSHKYISTQIEKDIPMFIRMEYPAFTRFIVQYYEWMEKVGAPYQFLANILNYSDVDRTSLEFLEIFASNYLKPLPDIIFDQNNIATLIKNIEQYYSARGSEKAFQFMFRLFQYHDKDIEFYYPSYDMLRVSDGKWVNKKSLKIIDPPDNLDEWLSGQIEGDESGAKAVIDDIRTYRTKTSDIPVAELFINEFDVVHSPRKFKPGEEITITTIADGKKYKARTERVFHKVKITEPGKYYIPDQRVHINGEDAKVYIDYVSKGEVSGFTLLSGGSGYKKGDRIYTTGDDYGTGAYGRVLEVDENGTITDIYMQFGGHDYQRIHEVKIASVEGKDAQIVVESDNIGSVGTVEIRDFGLNYEAATTEITFNTMIRIYNVNIEFENGEHIIGRTSGAEGIIEYQNKRSGVISVRLVNGEFEDGEIFDGQRWGGFATIYDQSLAKAKLIEGCLCEYNGEYLNMDGHISSLKYIQDSYFYQMFSYMLRTDRDKSEWADYIENVHPAGTIGFSYRDAINQYKRESSSGFIAPRLDTVEFYKFRWESEQYHGGYVRPVPKGHTQIKQYKNVVIDDIINIKRNEPDKTTFCYGSEITIK